MSASNKPKNGDFTSYAERLSQSEQSKPPETALNHNCMFTETNAQSKKQTIEDVLLNGEEPTEKFLEEMSLLNELPPLSDEELEQQALEPSGFSRQPLD